MADSVGPIFIHDAIGPPLMPLAPRHARKLVEQGNALPLTHQYPFSVLRLKHRVIYPCPSTNAMLLAIDRYPPALQQIRPDILIFLCSGYSEEAATASFANKTWPVSFRNRFGPPSYWQHCNRQLAQPEAAALYSIRLNCHRVYSSVQHYRLKVG